MEKHPAEEDSGHQARQECQDSFLAGKIKVGLRYLAISDELRPRQPMRYIWGIKG